MPSGTVSSQPDANVTAAVDDPQIELIGVRKLFGELVAVEGADLAVGDGELFAILGPSGSGKTTVLRMIAGFEQPTAGAIKLGGADVTALPARRRDVNTVFQEYALFPHMTVAQNVEYGLKVRGVPKAERRRRTADALDMVRLTDHARRRPAQLSGGQRQRVALARALIGRPRVLLLDEPLGALDLKLREQMQIELKAIQREVGITFVIVTHDQDEALTLCDRLAVFNDGRIEQIGKARDVYENPANRFVADFVGTSNVLDGAAAEELIGRAGMFVVRPERIGVFAPGTDSVPGVRTVEATVSEIIYAGPHHPDRRAHASRRHPDRHRSDRQHMAAARPAPRQPNHVGLARKSRPPPVDRGVAHATKDAVRRANRPDAHRLRRPGPELLDCLFELRASRWQRRDTAEARAAVRRRRRRRRTEHHRVGRLRRGRLQRPGRRLGDAVRAADRMPDQREARQHVRRDGAADADRSVRRRLGVRRCHPAADLRGRRRPGQHVAGAQLRDDFVVPQRQAVEFGGRADVRDSARLGRQPADVQHRGRPRRAELLGGGVRRRRQVQGQGHRLRLPHLHRRCRAVSVQDQAGAGHQGPVLADTRTTRRRNRIAQEAAREHRRVLVGLHQGGAGVRIRHVGDRHHLAGDRQHHRRGEQGSGQHRAAEGRRHRLVGHLDDLVEGRPPQLHVQVDELDLLTRGERPSRRVLR